MTADGFARLSAVQAKILLGTGAATDGGGQAQSTFTDIAFSVVLAHTSPTDDDLQVKDLPPTPPRLAAPSSPDAPLCLWYDNDQSGDRARMHLTTGGRSRRVPGRTGRRGRTGRTRPRRRYSAPRRWCAGRVAPGSWRTAVRLHSSPSPG